ncbi:MAG TPA: CPBP family intramembrane glutamic endopeptidase [Ktedonobacterales bacterium]|nr:CPBP family intramembrane glutamic endopeptidase [Ktedonobacterales bacterium]
MTTDATADPSPDDTSDNIPDTTADAPETALEQNDVASAALPGDIPVVPVVSVVPDIAAHEAEWLARFDASIPRNTVRDTWNWAWKDTAGRVLPFFAGAGLYAWLSGRGPEGIGITAEGWRRETLLGIAVGMPLAGLAAAFRGWVAPGYRLPTDADQLTQTLFYFAINAPGEELFWRGTVQDLAVRGLARVPRIGKLAGLLGWAAATAVFGAYQRLGKWSWRSIAGVTFAGAIFGALYQWPRSRNGRRSILAATIAHGFATAGFLSWADFSLYLRQRRRFLATVRSGKIVSAG